MTYIISTKDGSTAHPLVRMTADGGRVVVAEVDVLYARHSDGIVCGLALLARQQNPAARITVDGRDADELCSMPPRTLVNA